MEGMKEKRMFFRSFNESVRLDLTMRDATALVPALCDLHKIVEVTPVHEMTFHEIHRQVEGILLAAGVDLDEKFSVGEIIENVSARDLPDPDVSIKGSDLVLLGALLEPVCASCKSIDKHPVVEAMRKIVAQSVRYARDLEKQAAEEMELGVNQAPARA
jgi:hypothetical protein